MQPAALVLPARDSTMVQPLSRSMRPKMSAATAVSRDVKDMSRMAWMIGVASKAVTSTCRTGFLRTSFFVMGGFPLKKILDTGYWMLDVTQKPWVTRLGYPVSSIPYPVSGGNALSSLAAGAASKTPAPSQRGGPSGIQVYPQD